MRAPVLNDAVADSIEALLADMPPAAFVDTAKEAGVKYLARLVEHHRSPAQVARRRAVADATKAYRERK